MVGQISSHHGQTSHEGAPAAKTLTAIHNEPLAVLRTNIHRTITTSREDSATEDTETALLSALLAGHDDNARAILIAQTALSPDEADARIHAWLPTINAARDEIKRDADDFKHYLAAGAWATFLSALVGLIAAAVGGWVGTRHIHKVFHLRRYPGRP
jgi:hypothetical protein